MKTSNKTRNRIGLLKIPRILPNRSRLKMDKLFGEKLPGAFCTQIFRKKW